MVPLIELHAHLEGTISPDMCQKLADKNGIDLPDIFQPASWPPGSYDGGFYWDSFEDCVTRVYDAIASTVRTPEDYYAITYDYLSTLAGQNCIYSELIISPDHAREVGLPYTDMLSGIVEAIDKARDDHGIECRLSATLIRHLGVEQATKTAQEIIDNPHSYVKGIDLAGAEVPNDLKEYLPILKCLRGEGYRIRPHVGEVPGCEQNIRIAIEELECWRLGHGIQAMKDPYILNLLKEREVLLEISCLSNYFAGVIPKGEPHPIKYLYDMGIPVCLNSDDPGLFGTSIYMETRMAMHDQMFTMKDIKQMNFTAARFALVEAEVKEKLIKQVLDYDIG